MSLTLADRSWIDAYREAVAVRYPGAVVHMALFGSKARGDDDSDSDLDLLLIVKNDSASLKRDLRRLGYGLASTGETIPSILVYTAAEWESRKRTGSSFRSAVERDEVRLL